jgi:hypothetical protein
VVDALERIHAALDEGGVVVDTQPVSPRPPVVGGDGRLGTLDMREWEGTIEAVDERIVETVERGLFSVTAERRLVVTDLYDSGAELVATTSDWAGTRVPPTLARRAQATRGEVRLYQDVRVRILSRE